VSGGIRVGLKKAEKRKSIPYSSGLELKNLISRVKEKKTSEDLYEKRAWKKKGTKMKKLSDYCIMIEEPKPNRPCSKRRKEGSGLLWPG